MQYYGGKGKSWGWVTTYLNKLRGSGQPYLEPFMGGAWVLQGVSGSGVRIASDKNAALVTMFKAVLSGWLPPSVLSYDDWLKLQRSKDPENPLTAFAGFGCSFGGTWFNGFARDKSGRNYALNARNSLLSKAQKLKGVNLSCCDYRDWGKFSGLLVYCDPPYSNTNQKYGVGGFDSPEFWGVVRGWSKDNLVVVSEYSAPTDFVAFAERPLRLGLRVETGMASAAVGHTVVRTERLFVHRECSKMVA